MVKIGRFACILTPMLCTIASIICLAIVMIGGTNKSSGWVNGLFFLKIDTRFATSPSSLNLIPGTKIDDALLTTGLGNKVSKQIGIHDFYTAHLWNYCYGTINNDTDALVWSVDQCTKPTGSFYFNIVEIFHVESAASGKNATFNFPDAIQKVNTAIKAVSRVMVVMYCCGMAVSIVTFVLGWFGVLSRWGSFVTTIFADVAFFFLLVGSSILTALYTSLQKGFNTTFNTFGVYAYLCSRTLSLAWLAVLFSLLGAIFWMFSTCCCSGRSDKILGRDDNGKSRKEKGPYTYEKVSSSFMTTQSVGTTAPQQNVPGYEPYKHAGAH